ncbi:imm11 family protein [Moraxella sp. ZY210820]|uniref:imm11 family protein n=1 Tax=unclassified Moraxella TaxID=2685852 RepID=UPI00272FC099|nr:DUF1629 domain-containing protein [Moraxella sp. ZY210820]WLF84794.1 hypothetical protein LU301_04850 [Moraxella sp. ZY210820]
MSNYAWLYEYRSFSIANTYGIVVKTVEFDGSEIFFLEEKKKYDTLDSLEESKLELLDKIHLNFDDIWHDYEYLEYLPTKLFKEPDINYSNLPKENEIFFRITNGYLIINEKLYDVISKFNLGKTHFSQVYIYDIETKEQLSDVPYYFVNIAEKFEFLDVENSQGIEANFYQPEHPVRSIGEPKDDDIKLSLSAEKFNLDLWHDPKLRDSLFLSDRLTQALFKAGFTQKELGLIRCVVK